MSEEEIAQFISSYIFFHPLTAGQRHSNVFKLACEACRRHYPQKSILRELTVFFEHTDFRPEELTKVLSSGYKQVNEHAPASSPASAPSFQKDIRTKRQYSTAENSDTDDEAYWLGEEFRKGTPLFPRSLYNNLPDLLNDCIIEDGSEREQDVALLSDLTALSAALPQTFGIYNHKKYSTHIFSVILSPAASGKSIAQTGRYLLEEIHSEILSTSESMMKNYQTVHNNWQSEYQKQKKKGEACSEEPQRPPFKMLFIPATTSYTRMQMQMQDNGPQGSIIFDTEAQTLSTANHLDCGNFDDMLRKAFEHENLYTPSQIGFVADGYSRTNRRPIEQLRKRIAQPHPDLHFPRSSALERNGRRLRLTGRFFQTDCASCLRIISLLSGSSGSFSFQPPAMEPSE